MLRLPIVTYNGDHALFTAIQKRLASSLPQESVEWRRSFGRPTRCVHVEVDFMPFSEETITKETGKSILGHPVFHTFWTDCMDLTLDQSIWMLGQNRMMYRTLTYRMDEGDNPRIIRLANQDVETYKSGVRDSLQSWIQFLRQHSIQDWMVVLIEAPDTKKTNKLIPRTTVLDKIKNDFGGSKQSERCVSLIDPTKSDSRSVESWQLLLSKIRHLLMIAYNRALNKFEEAMRTERERRIEQNWSFCKYFLLQEELAQVFNLLELHDEALVQYDELDALFTQFILNSAAGEIAHWLSNFNRPCEMWEGLFLSEKVNSELQEKIRSKCISLLEFRNYLFQCQSALLIKQNKPWEMAARSLVFLQNTVGELRILEVDIADGGVACWGFLSCLEIIKSLSKYKNPSTTDSHALHTAPLWAYARDKLKELGQLCGLMPGCNTSSEQLHMLITLVCGMGTDPHTHEDIPETDEKDKIAQMTPMTRLKEALSSQETFKKHFLDLSEVAISTYKHIGRIRSARLIGRDLALFYIKEGSLHQAATFLSDQLKTFIEEGWDLLTAHTQTKLAKCYLATNDAEKYIKTCIQLAACPVEAYKEVRIKAFKDMMDATQDIKEGEPLTVLSERIFDIGWMKIVSTGPIILGSIVEMELIVHSKLPVAMRFDKIEVQLKRNSEKAEKPAISNRHKNSDIERKTSSTSSISHSNSRKFSSTTSGRSNSEGSDSASHHRHTKSIPEIVVEDEDEEIKVINPYLKKLQMELHLDFKQDKSLSTVSVNCTNSHKVLRREDSHGGIESLEKSVVKEIFTDCFSANDITIEPGANEIRLNTEVKHNGIFSSGQVVLSTKKLEFVSTKGSIIGKSLVMEVINEKPQIFLGRKERDLLAGICQSLILTVKSGSSQIKQGMKVKLKSSKGLKLRQKEDKGETEVENSTQRVFDFEKEIDVVLKEILPFNQTSIELQALAELAPQKDASTVEHSVCITSELLEEPRLDIDIHFIPPFMSSHKLHTANLKKFIQVTVTGIVKHPIQLFEASLSFLDSELSLPLKPLNPAEQRLVVCTDQSASYMWELSVDYSIKIAPVMKAQFKVMYQPMCENSKQLEEARIYKYDFDIQNYKTLYSVRAKVEPSKGSEFCRAGNMCHFSICLQHVDSEDAVDGWKKNKEPKETAPSCNSIMYEVITDQTMWAVCGRTSGVLSLEAETKQNVVLDVMPLIGGFLPLPSVRLSKYIPAETKLSAKDGKKHDIVGTASSVPRLEPFSPGQVYNFSKALQVHVLPAANSDLSIG